MVENGNKVLHVCAEFGRIELFEWFVDRYKANTMMTNYHGETPFHIAAKERQIDIIKLYHEKYTDINNFKIEHRANDDYTAVLFACMNTNLSILDYLVN